MCVDDMLNGDILMYTNFGEFVDGHKVSWSIVYVSRTRSVLQRLLVLDGVLVLVLIVIVVLVLVLV